MKKTQLNIQELFIKATYWVRRHFSKIRNSNLNVVVLIVILVTAVFIVSTNQYMGVVDAYDSLLQVVENKDAELQSKDEELRAKQRRIDELTDQVKILSKQLEGYEELVDNRPKYFTPNDWYVSSAATPKIYTAIPLSEDLQQYTYTMCCYFDMTDVYDEVLAIMWQETHYNASLTNENDNGTIDYGLMQINSSNKAMLVDNLGVTNLLDPQQNICCGCYIIKTLLNYYDGNTRKAIMAYNMGVGNVDKLSKQGIYTSDYYEAFSIKLTKLQANQYE